MALGLDLVFDFACPWCRVGERHLEQALTQVKGAVEIQWLPFQLNSELPQRGVPRQPYLEDKLGALVEEAHAPLDAIARAEGWRFRFDLMTVEPNTMDAHRLMLWEPAQEVLLPLARRLFDAHWEEGLDVGDRATLATLAGEAGLSVPDAVTYLKSGEGARDVEISQNGLQRAGVGGVPCFIVNGEYLAQGALPVPVLADFLQRGMEGRLD